MTPECKTCRSQRWAAYYAQHREKLIAAAALSTRKRRERPEVREQERKASRERKRVVLADPVQRERHRERTREWFRDNCERVNTLPSRAKPLRAAYTARYNAAKLQATPRWADMEQIAAFYLEAARLTAETGVPHEVDHKVPLRHPLVCGLHVPNNLQVVPMTVNRSKSNRFIPTIE